MAPTGLIRSWQTREHSSAARSRASMVGPDMDGSPVGVQGGRDRRIAGRPRSWRDTPHPHDRQGPMTETPSRDSRLRNHRRRHAKPLLDTLTDIVSRAAAATLAISFSSVARRIKNDLSPVISRRRSIGSGDHGGCCPPAARRASRRRGERRARGGAEPRWELRPGRSARRHQGISRRPRRVHRQCRHRHAWRPYRRHYRRAGAAACCGAASVGGGAERLRLRFGEGPPKPWPQRDPHAARRRRGWRWPPRAAISTSRPRTFSRACPVGAALRLRLGGEVLPHRAGRCRCLSAAGADPRMGHRGGLRHPRRRRRQRDDAATAPLRFGRMADKFLVPGFIAWGDPAMAASASI